MWKKNKKTTTPSHFRVEYFKRSSSDGMKRALEDVALLEDQAVSLWRETRFTFTEIPLLSFLLLINGPEE